ncbi:MAG: hypothetical protein VX320_00050 [Candidatus Thermoplasmatota archaeon]|nr:hypothetical protein [Candidatus Thermoplasmatota archaeon]
MGFLGRLFGGGADDSTMSDMGSERRLEALSGHSIDASVVPDESIPIEEDAWTLAPSPTRARVGTSGIEPPPREEKIAQPVVDTKEIQQKLDNRFDRIEASMAMMDARLTQIRETNEMMHALPTDTLVTVEGEVDVGDASEDGEEPAPSSEDEEVKAEPITVNLLDLYEDRVADLNPFLNRRADAHSTGPTISTSEIAALLLDHLSAATTSAFLEKASSSGMITAEESSELNGLVQLADPAVNENGGEHLPHRELLMFNAMVESWRASKLPDDGG